jgi:hypothetical protein
LIKKGDSIDEDRLVGLVSWGRECAQEGAPGVYARISFFYDWIVETVCENFPDDAPPYMECKTPDEDDWFIMMDRPSREPTKTSTNAPTETPTIKPTISPTRKPVPTFSPFASNLLTNLTDDDALRNITDDDDLTSLEEAIFLSWAISGLQECEGDCDNDDECEGDLVCFLRDEETVISPGCSGYEFIGQEVDVCIKPIFLP